MSKSEHLSYFEASKVLELVKNAEASGEPLLLVKDDGAYLLTYDKHGKPLVPLYAHGHRPPIRDDRPGSNDLRPESPWMVQRIHTEKVWGGDDFGEELELAFVRQALGPERDRDLRVFTLVEEIPYPADLPPLFSGESAVYRLLGFRIEES
jgi:hypothetical protein